MEINSDKTAYRSRPVLQDGGACIGYHDWLVGNQEGLLNLRKACEAALEKGEYFGNNLGDYIGVKKIDDESCKRPAATPFTRLRSAIFSALLIVLLVLMFTGSLTVFSWRF